jgi:hypothetical protein
MVRFPTQKQRDNVFNALSNFVTLSIGPLSKWAGAKMSSEEQERYIRNHFSTLGKIRKIRIVFPKKLQNGGKPIPSALLEVEPAMAGKVLGADAVKGVMRYQHKNFLDNLPVELKAAPNSVTDSQLKKVVPFGKEFCVAEKK